MTSAKTKSLLIISLFLLNVFFLKSDFTIVYIVNFLSLAVIIAMLLNTDFFSEKEKEFRKQDETHEKSVDNLTEEKDVQDLEPNSENQLLDRIIKLLSEIMRNEGIIFFKYDSKDKSLIINRHKVTDATLNFESFFSGSDIPGISINKRKSIYIDTIEDQRILNYYLNVHKERKELYLKPVFKNGNLYGVFALDSCDSGAFNESFVSVINQIIHIFQEHINEKRPVSSANESKDLSGSLELKLTLYSRLYHINSEEEFFNELKTIFPKYIQANNFYLVKKIDKEKAKVVSTLGAIEEAHLNFEFPLNEGIIGWAIENNKLINIDDVINENQFTVRFYQKEKKPETTRSVLISTIPVKEKFALVFESKEEAHFTAEMKEILYDLTDDISTIYESVLKRQELTKHIFYLEYPDLLSMSAFKHIFNIWKSLSVEKDLQFSLLSIKLMNNRFLNLKQSQIVQKFIIKEINNEILESDLLFQYNQQQLLLISFINAEPNIEDLVSRLSERVNHTRIFAENKTIEPQIIINSINNCQDKELNEVLFKLHLEQT